MTFIIIYNRGEILVQYGNHIKMTFCYNDCNTIYKYALTCSLSTWINCSPLGFAMKPFITNSIHKHVIYSHHMNISYQGTRNKESLLFFCSNNNQFPNFWEKTHSKSLLESYSIIFCFCFITDREFFCTSILPESVLLNFALCWYLPILITDGFAELGNNMIIISFSYCSISPSIEQASNKNMNYYRIQWF